MKENATNKDKRVIVEVAMEISLTPKILDTIAEEISFYGAISSGMSTSVGGIGPLLRERIIAQADEGADVIGVTLLYEKVWLQRWHAWGQFYLDKVKAGEYIARTLKKLPDDLTIKMFDGTDVTCAVWKATYGKAKVYFLDQADVGMIVYPGGFDAPPDTQYPDQWANTMRLKQSWLLGRGSLALLEKLNVSPDITILSETPTIFAKHDLVKDAYSESSRFAKTKYIFNDHTPLEYAHPVWTQENLEMLKFNPKMYKKLDSYKNNPQKIDITQMIIDVSDGVYGVSKIHGDVMRQMPTLQKYADKIETITNGVSSAIWQAKAFKGYKNLSDDQLLAVKEEEKHLFVNWLWLRYKFDSQWREDKKKRPIIMWMRRVTGYKRLDLLREIVQNDLWRKRFIDLDICMIVGGRIHQQDTLSDRLVFELLDVIQKYPELEGRVIILDNFNIWEAPKIFPGIDAAIMISDRGKEAAATGFMKAQMNGAMIIATPDGAVPESVNYYDPDDTQKNANGFEVTYFDDSPTPESLLHALTEFKFVYDDQSLRASFIKNALAQHNKIDVRKVAKEMLEFCDKVIDRKSDTKVHLVH